MALAPSPVRTLALCAAHWADAQQIQRTSTAEGEAAFFLRNKATDLVGNKRSGSDKWRNKATVSLAVCRVKRAGRARYLFEFSGGLPSSGPTVSKTRPFTAGGIAAFFCGTKLPISLETKDGGETNGGTKLPFRSQHAASSGRDARGTSSDSRVACRSPGRRQQWHRPSTAEG